MKKIEEPKEYLLNGWTLTEWFRYLSNTTWDRIDFSRRAKGIKIYETTITQNLLFEILRLSRTRQLPIKLYESTSEKTNGNDIEIIIEVENGIIKMPCQAKLIKINRKYETINHKVGSNYQCNLLLQYAQKIQGIPLYLFYNSISNLNLQGTIRDKIEFEIEDYGCSIGEANKIVNRFYNSGKWIIPKFEDLHPDLVFPFDFLAKVALSKNSYDILSDVFEIRDLKIYPLESIIEDEWEDRVPPPGLGYIFPRDIKLRNLLTTSIPTFKPSYRIVISKNLNLHKSQIYLQS